MPEDDRGSRENMDLWRSLFYYYPNGEWMGKRIFTRRFWRNKYVWHDSFGKYWNRLLGCRLWGHRDVHNIEDPRYPAKWHCFNCERQVALIVNGKWKNKIAEKER